VRSNTRVVLPDNSVVWLNTNSTLEYAADFGTATREVSLKGEAFFDVKKDSKSFIVKTDNISIYVKGTRFNVRAYANEADIKTTLEEGKVELQVKGDKDIFTMRPGDQITFNSNLKKITRNTVDPTDYSSWKEERLVFDDTPLRDIILKLENRYNVDIEVDSALAEKERLTMTIEQETIDEVLEFIQLSSGLKYKKDKNQISIYESVNY
jgi:ferric-dicitrate binding protein FerR (iron transport regulator)